MKILIVISEDWFALSHAVPLIKEVAAIAGEVVVATRSSGRLGDIDRLGVRTRAFDMRRGSLNFVTLVKVRDGLARIIDGERPDVVHAISMQAVVMTSLALERAAHRPAVALLHLTGFGYLGHSRSPVALGLRPIANAAIRRTMSKFNAWLVAENGDDVTRMVSERVAVSGRTAVVPGAGIDAACFPALAPPANPVPCAAFVGRMLFSKGVHILVRAHQLLAARGVKLDVALYGAADGGSRQAIAPSTLSAWNRQAGVRWYGRTNDVVEVWRTADIAVMPALWGEGMPRAMLEAGSCGRPLVVSNIPGCREFVRYGVEGFVVPPGDPEALAGELGRLAGNPALRSRTGAAARRRILEGYTEQEVRARIRAAYEEAWAARSSVGATGSTRPGEAGPRPLFRRRDAAAR